VDIRLADGPRTFTINGAKMATTDQKNDHSGGDKCDPESRFNRVPGDAAERANPSTAVTPISDAVTGSSTRSVAVVDGSGPHGTMPGPCPSTASRQPATSGPRPCSRHVDVVRGRAKPRNGANTRSGRGLDARPLCGRVVAGRRRGQGAEGLVNQLHAQPLWSRDPNSGGVPMLWRVRCGQLKVPG